MRVLLVYSNQSTDVLPAPPIGLSYVARATRQAGHEVRFLDLLVSRRASDDLRSAVRDWRPEVVGLSVRNIENLVHQRIERHLGDLARLIAIVREETDASVVLGGPAVSILGPMALSHIDADFAVVGEGEVTFPRLLDAMDNRTGEPQYPVTVPGVCYRQGEEIVSTTPEWLPSFESSGMEEWVDWTPYERHGSTWPIQTKRGCRMNCSYCAYTAVEGHGCRLRPATEVVDEIATVADRVGPRTFEFVDSTFNVPVTHALEICREITSRGLKVNLTAMGINPLDTSEELFSSMRAAGFNSMMITPEAANPTMLRNLRKGFMFDDVVRTARLARESEIASAWFFMLGGPGETPETVEQSVSFAEEYLSYGRCLTIFFTGVRILPGTELASQAVKEGYVSPDNDLFDPVFYFSADVSEDFILRRINQAIARHPNMVHTAEDGQSLFRKLFHKTLYLTRTAPPFWRYLPAYLSLPPWPTLRRHFPLYGAKV